MTSACSRTRGSMHRTGAVPLKPVSEPAGRTADRAPGVYDLPVRLDRAVAERKLETLGIAVDEPIEAQVDYVESRRDRR